MAQKTDFRNLAEKLNQSQGLPENISTEAQLWDVILKKELFFMSEQLFPLIYEIYEKSYERHIPIRPLATEYPTDNIKTQKISAIRSDVAVQIDSRDIFHFECESKKAKNITIRIFEYDTRIALSYDATPEELHFPHSALINLAYQRETPKSLVIHLHFENGSIYPYQIPVLDIHAYTLEDIRKKHLSILIPFLPVWFRRFLPSKEKSQKISKKELTSFYKAVILILDEEVKNNYLNVYDQKMILELLRKSLIRVFYSDKTLLQEVLTMTEPDFKLENEEYYYALKLQKEKLFQIEHEIYLKNKELSQKNNELSQKDNELSKKDNEIALLKRQLAVLQKQQ